MRCYSTTCKGHVADNKKAQCQVASNAQTKSTDLGYESATHNIAIYYY